MDDVEIDAHCLQMELMTWVIEANECVAASRTYFMNEKRRDW